jgi:hypothetical protein
VKEGQAGGGSCWALGQQTARAMMSAQWEQWREKKQKRAPCWARVCACAPQAHPCNPRTMWPRVRSHESVPSSKSTRRQLRLRLGPVLVIVAPVVILIIIFIIEPGASDVSAIRFFLLRLCGARSRGTGEDGPQHPRGPPRGRLTRLMRGRGRGEAARVRTSELRGPGLWARRRRSRRKWLSRMPREWERGTRGVAGESSRKSEAQLRLSRGSSGGGGGGGL